MTTPDVTALAVGHVTHDRYDDEIVAGGCAWYAARVWALLGARARLVTTVGHDFAVESSLEGLETHVERGGRTTAFVNRYPTGRDREQWVTARARWVSPAQIPAQWRHPDVVFLAPVMGEVDLARWRMATTPRLFAVGVQGYIKDAAPGVGERRVAPRRWRPSAQLLRQVDVAFLSDEDVRHDEELAGILTTNVPLVFRTHGPEGYDVIERGEVTSVAVRPVAALDPTGAGDSFAAGTLVGLAHGFRPPAAARLGAAVAREVVQARGGEALEPRRFQLAS